MANVQYMVMYRYLHPVSGKPVSNKKKGYKQLVTETINEGTGIFETSDFKDEDLKINPATGKKYTVEEYLNARNYTTDDCYDMMFLFKGIKETNSYSYNYSHYSYKTDSFIQVNGDPWFTASVTGSLESAMEAARRLIRKVGVANVKVVKQVPLDIQVVIE